MIVEDMVEPVVQQKLDPDRNYPVTINICFVFGIGDIVNPTIDFYLIFLMGSNIFFQRIVNKTNAEIVGKI